MDFFLGFVAGIAVVALMVYMYLRRLKKALNAIIKSSGSSKSKSKSSSSKAKISTEPDAEDIIDELLSEINEIEDFKKRMDKLDAIMAEQIDLMGAIDGPSKGSSHSRWKNDIIKRIKDLDKEKIELMDSIVADGFNPTLKVSIGGEEKMMKLSEISDEIRGHLKEEPTPKEKSDFINNQKNDKKSHLRLVTNDEQGEDEDE